MGQLAGALWGGVATAGAPNRCCGAGAGVGEDWHNRSAKALHIAVALGLAAMWRWAAGSAQAASTAGLSATNQRGARAWDAACAKIWAERGENKGATTGALPAIKVSASSDKATLSCLYSVKERVLMPLSVKSCAKWPA